MVEDRIHRTLADIGGYLGLDLHAQSLERLGGLTNQNYLVRTLAGPFVLRLAGHGTESYLDRRVEKFNATSASQAGVNVEVLFFDERDGTMLTRFLENATTMSAAAFQEEAALQKAGRVLRQLHQEARPFEGRFELFEQMDRYLGVVNQRGGQLPDGYRQTQMQAERIRRALGGHRLPMAPCHCDPLVENFLDCGERMHLIDFEYAGNNDPMWDLGDLAVEGEFSPDQEVTLLRAYFGGPPCSFDEGRFVMYKALCDLLWTLWGVVQHLDGNPAQDFWAYANSRLQRCQGLLGRPEFELHLRAVESGP